MRFLLLAICLTGLFAQSSFSLLEQAISKAYTHFYAKYPFKIQAIKVELASGNLSMLDQILKVASPQDLRWRTQQFLNKEGVLSLDQKIWIKYSLNASIGIYKSKTMLRKDQNLDASNTYFENIPFTHFNALPIDASYINNSSARSFIAPNTILSIDRVGPKILIYKHEIFNATLKEGPIFLETSLQALENGVLNQVIQALNMRSKKVIQVKITGLLKGEVL
ncbi:flagellar basal body P-ring formation chaperone FlgA [Helicobacter suis]|uniref:flagellar basal body P-ring formation chaperone FlgA n=1 Tax=Helicobacter suis TaxID=104628 RepID=UPI0013D4334A|nr:flagellar basal body P-ring formation chaperone FlgA [Helicobacter suis]